MSCVSLQVSSPEAKTAMAGVSNPVPATQCQGHFPMRPAPRQLISVPCMPLQVPNPEDKTAMAAGVDAVLRSQSDLGVVLDTDVDRSAVVSRDGQAIAQNRYIALMSVITLRSAASGWQQPLRCFLEFVSSAAVPGRTGRPMRAPACIALTSVIVLRSGTMLVLP